MQIGERIYALFRRKANFVSDTFHYMEFDFMKRSGILPATAFAAVEAATTLMEEIMIALMTIIEIVPFLRRDISFI